VTSAFALRYAARNLLRGGQRTLLAIACVGFGVMSLVGLQLLSSMLAASIALDARVVLGGDASLSRGDRTLTAMDIEELERMRERGTIAAYTLTSQGAGALLRRSGSGRTHILGRSLGVDPTTFPLLGEVRVGKSPATAFGRLIAQPGTAVITRDVADKVGLATGDRFTLGGGPEGTPARLRVTGIAEMTPDRQGDTVFYSLATARRLAGREDVAKSALVLWASAPPAATLTAGGWSITKPDEIAKRRARVVDLFGMMLKGSGLLGLMLGGIGMSNTMQVLLARRRLEIATLKTLGYARSHLVLLFSLETGMLGLIGGLVGAAAGAGLSSWLRLLLGGMGPILLGPVVDLRELAGGVAVGVATAVLFGLQSIVRASAVRPSTLLRDLPASRAWGETAMLYAALGALFSALAAVVMGSALYGIGIVAAGVAGLALLMAVLGAGFFAIVTVPVPLPSLVALARKNLRRQPVQTLVALVALFCGVFTIGFAAATISNGRQRLASRELPSGGYNITIHAAPADAAPVAALLEREGVKAVERFITAPVSARNPSGRALDVLRGVTGCDGDRTGTVQVVDGVWGQGPGTALAPAGPDPRRSDRPAARRQGSAGELHRPGGGSAARRGRGGSRARRTRHPGVEPGRAEFGDAGGAGEPVRLRHRHGRIGARRGRSADRELGGPRDARSPA
jgi:putative ABC transport system permease protein